MANIDRDDLISFISDGTKDLWGFRPRYNYRAMSDQELQELADDVSLRLDAHFRGIDEQKAVDDAKIAQACESLGIDRATYDRWMESLEPAETF
jgi:hypothetical protein